MASIKLNVRKSNKVFSVWDFPIRDTLTHSCTVYVLYVLCGIPKLNCVDQLAHLIIYVKAS